MKIDLEIQIQLYGERRVKLTARDLDKSDFKDELKKIHKLEQQVIDEFKK